MSKTKEGLTRKQELFCQYYVSKEFYANATQSYIHAYGLEPKNKADYNNAQVSAYNNLRKTKILKRINELLDSEGLNDQFADKQLLHLMTQEEDLRTKLGALKEYNKLKQRITDKLDVTTDGEKLSDRDDNSTIFAEFLKQQNKK